MIPCSLRLNYEAHSSFSSISDHSHGDCVWFVLNLMGLSLHMLFFLMLCCNLQHYDYQLFFLNCPFPLHYFFFSFPDLPYPRRDLLMSVHFLPNTFFHMLVLFSWNIIACLTKLIFSTIICHSFILFHAFLI
jgi:hypothetical protein